MVKVVIMTLQSTNASELAIDEAIQTEASINYLNRQLNAIDTS